MKKFNKGIIFIGMLLYLIGNGGENHAGPFLSLSNYGIMAPEFHHIHFSAKYIFIAYSFNYNNISIFFCFY